MKAASPQFENLPASRILIVEDDILNGFLMEETLQMAGHEVLGPARTVPRALALLEGCAVDAAVLDLQIGEETSLEVARRLDDLGIPWAMITGHSRAAIPPQYDHVRVLRKPFSVAEFLELTADTLAQVDIEQRQRRTAAKDLRGHRADRLYDPRLQGTGAPDNMTPG